ncbi:carboxypeptidase-like regulatory domain-containing protein [Desertivirga brevis]|uniref:carboxypeptidase-like regulatory domain-containing protein n=1 Tax=Desertivirga brevis TaxID=2810310 RepID=UPI001A96AB69|nr:carboxypeptidase-like regulatory domain-containing protein [Pedobacter sp. SYSU D00873]
MKKFLACLVLISILTLSALCQTSLINSRNSSYYTYIFPASNSEVENFYKHKQFKDDLLKAPVDSFLTSAGKMPAVPAGNYIKVMVIENQLHYELIENRTAYLKILNNRKDFQFVLTDKESKEITDAQVYINNKRIYYDNSSKIWRSQFPKSDTSLVQVNYEGITNYTFVHKFKGYSSKLKFENWLIRKTPVKYTYPVLIRLYGKITGDDIPYRYRHYKRNRNNSSEKFQGYMVFSKPKYKPADTVRFKAFIVERKRYKPVNQKLDVVLYNDGKRINLGNIAPYKKGAYEYSFPIHDSLKLSLDKWYSVDLRHKFKLYRTEGFYYENYELKSNKFSLRVSKDLHSRNQTQALYFSATDENGLNVQDGRVEITITTSTIEKFHGDHIFVSDTLWRHQIKLDAVGETKLEIPESIFPNADFEYKISAKFLNSNNEKREQNRNIKFLKSAPQIKYESKGDSLYLSFENGLAGKNYPASIAEISLADTLVARDITLPAVVKINPFINAYKITASSVNEIIPLRNIQASVSVNGYRTKDSLFIQINNPRKIPYWFTILKGNKIIDRGRAESTDYKHKCTKNDNVKVTVNYVWANESKEETTNIQFLEKQLNLDIKQPLVIAPGEKADFEISVTNAAGKAVKDVDLTAYSITSKFNAGAPNVPYFGKSFKVNKQFPLLNYSEAAKNGIIELNWTRWAKNMGLDSIEYFRFTHPKTIYTFEANTENKITQLSPFVVEKGNILPIHILYIDNKPVYFNQAEQLERFSFALDSGYHTVKFRLKDREIIAPKVCLSKGKRLILSINADSMDNKEIQVSEAPSILTDSEARNLNKYMIRLVNNYSPRMAVIKDNSKTLLFTSDGYGSKLAGPLSYNHLQYQVLESKPVDFIAEPSYSYEFSPGLLKQKSIEGKYPFSTFLAQTNTPNYKDQGLTNNEIDSIWKNYVDLRCSINLLFTPYQSYAANSAELKIDFKNENGKKLPFVKHILVYKYNEPDFLNMYPGNQRNLGHFKEGKYRIMVLLKDDMYVLADSINIKPFGKNFYNITLRRPHPKDSLSIKISKLLYEKAIAMREETSPSQDNFKETFNEVYTNSDEFKSVMAGHVYDNSNVPLIGVSIRIKGMKAGGTTDINGYFKIKVPEQGSLVISYIGFQSKQVAVNSSMLNHITLDENSSALQEVVVVGYGTQMKSSLMGRVAGVSVSSDKIRIRGAASLNGNAKPLIIVDGVPFEGTMDDLNSDALSDISVLKNEAATAIYGARAANGVIVITTKKGAKQKEEQMAAQESSLSIRKNFSDNAFWQPKLKTDVNGKARFSAIFPDDITDWQSFFIAMNGKRESGYTQTSLKAFKPISASFYTPEFTVAGDELKPLGKVLNYTSESVQLTRNFSYNNKSISRKDITVKNSQIDTFKVIADGKDSLKFEYTIQKQNGYSDGEIRRIPVFNAGALETKGSFDVFENDTTLNYSFDPKLGPVTLHAEASVLPALMEETERLRNYQYLCNEQLASKLKGLLVQKRIKAYLNQPFENDRLVRQLIKKLDDSKKENGLWGWWKNSEAELWISKHVVEALLDAEIEGYKVDLNKKLLIEHLVYQLSSYRGMNKMDALYLLKKMNAEVDYKTPLALYEQELKFKKYDQSLFDKLELLRLKQVLGIKVNTDTLMKYSRKTMLGNLYFGENNFQFFNNSIQNTILAYRILKDSNPNSSILSRMRYYFLEQRSSGSWRNTYETSLILETILPDLIKGGQSSGASTLFISGSKNETVKDFPFTTTIDASSKININKQGGLPVYFTVYQQFWDGNPEKVNKSFTVDTYFEKKTKQVITTLKGGEEVNLKADVQVSAYTEFVMIEIPIPAGCSYDEKDQQWWGNEVHREYFKNKVSIFCRKLKEGKHTFTIKLMPRYSGVFTLNPAKAEMMYFPVFYGREAMKKVKVN